MNESRESFTGNDTFVFQTFVPYGTWLDHNGQPMSVAPIGPYLYASYRQQCKYEERTPAVENKSHDVWKPFSHYKREWIPISVPTQTVQLSTVANSDPTDVKYGFKTVHDDPFFAFRGGSAGAAGSYQPWKLLPTMYNHGSSQDLIPAPESLSTLVQTSLNATMPRVKAELSLLNSLYELKDFSSLRHSLDRAVSTVKKLSVLGLDLQQSGRVRRTSLTARQLLRTVSDNFLQWRFNIAPLLSDIAAIKRALSTVERRITRYINDAQTWRTAHFTCAVNENLGSATDFAYDVGPAERWYPMVNDAKVSVYPSYAASTFHAEIRYCFSYWRFQEEYALLLGTLDSLGVNLNPKIIWNAIPFSFLVDWVVNVNGFLDKFAIRNMDPVILISEYLWSIKRERVTSVQYQLNSGWNTPSVGQKQSLPPVFETAYRREITMPAMGLFNTSGLSSDELSLGGALLATRGKGHRHNRNR